MLGPTVVGSMIRREKGCEGKGRIMLEGLTCWYSTSSYLHIANTDRALRRFCFRAVRNNYDYVVCVFVIPQLLS